MVNRQKTGTHTDTQTYTDEQTMSVIGNLAIKIILASNEFDFRFGFGFSFGFSFEFGFWSIAFDGYRPMASLFWVC